ncbi:HPP family protein [Allohahella marinimesophila]|uniref:HPP transmembrane region domain-containing protein n=1 Tax=Allohahella marinimesophila TaxID=1054972 RepID=A0ABP7NJJ7_9GAMM
MSVVHKWWHEFSLLIGLGDNATSHKEKLLSGMGAALGMYAIVLCNTIYPVGEHSIWVTACIGASAVLLFAAPHGALSQPWPLLGGYLVSAIIGVACQQSIPDTGIALSFAVGLAIVAMHYLRCLHPPGGAAALLAVVGGADITEQGYGFVLMPVLVNALVLMSVAVLFNAFFAWRRYPAHLAQRQSRPAFRPGQRSAVLTEEDFAAALHDMDSFIDVTPEDLQTLVALADEHAGRRTRPAIKPLETVKKLKTLFRKDSEPVTPKRDATSVKPSEASTTEDDGGS